LIPMAYTPG